MSHHLPSTEPQREVQHSSDPTAVRCTCDAVFNHGGIMHGGADGVSMVGDLRWVGSDRIFWFAAHGDSFRDSHVFSFDEAIVESNSRVSFRRNGIVQAVFSTIRDAPVEDPEDYEIAWQLWQQMAPLRARFVESCFRVHLSGNNAL